MTSDIACLPDLLRAGQHGEIDRISLEIAEYARSKLKKLPEGYILNTLKDAGAAMRKISVTPKNKNRDKLLNYLALLRCALQLTHDPAVAINGNIQSHLLRLLLELDAQKAKASQRGADKARKIRGSQRSKWAEDVAQKLVKQQRESGGTYKDIWESIGHVNSPGNITVGREWEPIKVGREGDELIAVDLDSDQVLGNLTKDSFRKEYFTPARKKES